MDVPIVLGLDAHAPDDLKEKAICQLEQFSADVHLNIIEKIDINSYQKRW